MPGDDPSGMLLWGTVGLTGRTRLEDAKVGAPTSQLRGTPPAPAG